MATPTQALSALLVNERLRLRQDNYNFASTTHHRADPDASHVAEILAAYDGQAIEDSDGIPWLIECETIQFTRVTITLAGAAAYNQIPYTFADTPMITL